MLQKPDVHTTNILKLADTIEALPSGANWTKLWGQHRSGGPIDSFNMKFVAAETDCGTAGCILGVLRRNIALPEDQELGAEALAEKYLNISKTESNALFFLLYDYEVDTPGLQFEDITNKMAAKVLRHLALTGKVDWSIVQ